MENITNKEFVENLKKEWKTLWRERIDDKIRAEGIANRDYSMLFVERGTVIFATKKFRLLNFNEILQLHGIIDVDRVVSPHPSFGGWGRFIRTVIAPHQRLERGKRAPRNSKNEKQKPQLKKGGQGWLHIE